jgi:circadian clock protein KaiC
MERASEPGSPRAIRKAPTGIRGFDEITGGGLPAGRPTLVCGSAGCGKTLFGMEFLVRGAVEHGEPGVFLAFEETAEDLSKNVASLGFDLDDLVAKKLLAVDHVRVERSEIEETGEYDLEALFIRLGYAIDSIGAKRVVLDTIEALFAALPNEGILRAELRRLFQWLRDKGVSAVITGERGEGTLTRRGLEEYVSDCVILLDVRVRNEVATRRIRVVKYRGSSHGTNEYPFLIHSDGLSVLPITSIGLQHEVSSERVSTGIPRLDTMLGGEGLYRGSSVLVSGTAGAGKSSLGAHAVAAACRAGERCLYFAFEESEAQITRNMRSIGIDLEPFSRAGLLRFHATRPTFFGLEMHLATMLRLIEEVEPNLVVVDPVTNLLSTGSEVETHTMLMRLIDALKGRGITGIFNSLTSGGDALEQTQVGISSLMDTWLLLRFIEVSGERNRALYVLKSRGMAHSNQVRELVMSDRGIDLADVYVGPGGVLTGTARHAQEAKERAEAEDRRQVVGRTRRDVDRRRRLVEAQIVALRAELEADEIEAEAILRGDAAREAVLSSDRREMAQLRGADPRRRAAPSPNGNGVESERGSGNRRSGRRPAGDPAGAGDLEPAALRGGPVAQIAGGDRQPAAHLRGEPGGEIPARGDRSGAVPAAGAVRSDPGHPHAGPEAAGAHTEDHRGPVRHPARPRGVRSAPSLI